MPYLLDSNVVSEVMKNELHPGVVAWFSRLPRMKLSVITLEEQVFGLRRRSLLKKEA